MNDKRRRPSTPPGEPVRDILFRIVTEGPLHGNGQRHDLDAEPSPRAPRVFDDPEFHGWPFQKKCRARHFK
jgi:hypothetical protein